MRIKNHKKIFTGFLSVMILSCTLICTKAEASTKSSPTYLGWVVKDLSQCANLDAYERDDITAEGEEITKETLEQNVNAILKNYPEYKIKSQTRVNRGDYVDISIKGIEDGEITPFLNVEHMIARIGEGDLPPELDNIIPGRRTGKQVTVQIASDNFTYNINSDTVKVFITVNAIVDAKIYTASTLNEKYVTETLGCESVEDFYNRLQYEMGDAADQSSIINDILKETCPVDCPEKLIAQFADQHRQLIINQAFNGNVTQYRKMIGTVSNQDLQKYENGIYEYYRDNLPLMLIYIGIARKENIEASGKDYDQYISKLMKKENIYSKKELCEAYDTTYESGEDYLKRQYIIETVAASFSNQGVLYNTVSVAPSSEWYTDYSVPKNAGFKSFMDYRKITSTSSNQYKLQTIASTSYSGIRMVDGRYCMALGTYFGTKIGQYFDLILENGTRINCITGDIKSDKDTDYYHIFTSNGCCSEFIIDSDYLPNNIMLTGDMSNLYPQWDSPVCSVYVYDEYADF